MAGRASTRLAGALVVSLALHAWLMHGYYNKGAARGREDAGRLVARIVSSSPVTPDAIPLSNPASLASDAVEQRAPAVTMPGPAAAPPPAVHDGERSLPARAAAATQAMPQTSDPNYYDVGDLDVFPRALLTPDLNKVLLPDQEPASGRVRAIVLINEAGTVDAVRGVDAPMAEVSAAARSLLLRTRFTPARNKDGRIVKAQVVIALDYDLRTTQRGSENNK